MSLYVKSGHLSELLTFIYIKPSHEEPLFLCSSSKRSDNLWQMYRFEQVKPFGLLISKHKRSIDFGNISLPWTFIESDFGEMRQPSFASFPFTVTSPFSINCSPRLREQIPLSAKNFCNLGFSRVGNLDIFVVTVEQTKLVGC